MKALQRVKKKGQSIIGRRWRMRKKLRAESIQQRGGVVRKAYQRKNGNLEKRAKRKKTKDGLSGPGGDLLNRNCGPSGLRKTTPESYKRKILKCLRRHLTGGKQRQRPPGLRKSISERNITASVR